MSMWMALLKRKLSLFTFGLRNLTATLQAAALQNKERTKAASSNIITKDGMKKEIGDRRVCLHRGVEGCGASGHGLHVGISEACDLQILLFVHETGESYHQTNWRLRLKEHNAREHTKLRVKSLVHVELQSHFLDLIRRWKNIYNQFM